MTVPIAPRRRRVRRVLAVLVLLALAPPALFVVNGTLLAWGETPQGGTFAGVGAAPVEAGRPFTVVAYNVAKGFAPRGGLSFHDEATVRARLDKMADAVRAENPDVVVLSEVMREAVPCRVDQLEHLARAWGLRHFAFGENYSFGVPGCRAVGGNAVLSRTPVAPVANPSLAGRKPFFRTENSRRALFATVDTPRGPVLVASLHNDSFDTRNNAVQVNEILTFVGDRPALLAGDFNARPTQEPMRTLRESGRFTGAFDGEPTFPEHAARIDYVLAPAAWEHVGTRVLAGDASDHRAVVARFR